MIESIVRAPTLLGWLWNQGRRGCRSRDSLPQGSLTIATNPAGLTVPDPGFDIGVDVFLPRRSSTINQGGGSAEFGGDGTATFLIPSMGFSYRINPQLVFGLALFGNGGLNTNYDTNPFGRFGARGAAGVEEKLNRISGGCTFGKHAK